MSELVNNENNKSEVLDYKEKKQKKKLSEKQINAGVNNLKKYHENKRLEKKAMELLASKNSPLLIQEPVKPDHNQSMLKIESDDEIDIDEIIKKKVNKKNNIDDFKEILKTELMDLKNKIEHVANRTEKLYQLKKMKKHDQPQKEIQPIIIDTSSKSKDVHKSNSQIMLDLLRKNTLYSN